MIIRFSVYERKNSAPVVAETNYNNTLYDASILRNDYYILFLLFTLSYIRHDLILLYRRRDNRN